MTRRWLIVAGVLLAVLVLALPVLTYPLGRDQGEFATIGRGLLLGKIPYTDLWNPKPPAVFYLYAGAMMLFGQSVEALRALDLLAYPVIALALYSIGQRLANPRVGLLAALLFGVFYFTETFWTLTQNDGLVLAPMLLALACALRAGESRRGLLWMLAAGALSAWVVWFKYPFALFAGVVLLSPLLAGKKNPGAYVSRGGAACCAPTITPFSRNPDMISLRLLVGFALGFGLIGGGGLLYFHSLGVLDALIESARVTSQYTALTFNWADFRELMTIALGFRWQQWGLLWGLLALWPLLWRGQGHGGWWLLLWLLAGLAIMLSQAKGYDYHWLPMLPPLVLIGADTLDRAIHGLARRGLARRSEVPATFLLIVVLLAVLGTHTWRVTGHYLMGREDRAAYYSRFQAGEFRADESLAVADYLRERNVPGDSLYIWGFRPEIYYLTHLNPPTRFIFHFPLVAGWYPAAWRQENVDLLWAALPPYALVLQVDYMPWVTGRDDDSNTLLQEYNELRDWLAFNYELDTQIGNFFIWRRKS